MGNEASSPGSDNGTGGYRFSPRSLSPRALSPRKQTLDDWPVPPMVLFIEAIALPAATADGDGVVFGRSLDLRSPRPQPRPQASAGATAAAQGAASPGDGTEASSEANGASPGGSSLGRLVWDAPRAPDGEQLFASVAIDGDEIENGSFCQLPSGPIKLEPRTHAQRIHITIYRGAQDCEHPQVYAKLSCSIAKLIRYGAPLYTSLWLGLREFRGGTVIGGDLGEALARARHPTSPKVKVTLYRPLEKRREQQSLPMPDIQKALAQPHVFERDLWDSFGHMGNKDFRIAMVEGLIRCLDESNAVISALHGEEGIAMAVRDLGLKQMVEKMKEEVKEKHQAELAAVREEALSQARAIAEVLRGAGDGDLVASNGTAGAREVEAALRRRREVHDREVMEAGVNHEAVQRELSNSVTVAKESAERHAQAAAASSQKLQEALLDHDQRLAALTAEHDGRARAAAEAAAQELETLRQQHARHWELRRQHEDVQEQQHREEREALLKGARDAAHAAALELEEAKEEARTLQKRLDLQGVTHERELEDAQRSHREQLETLLEERSAAHRTELEKIRSEIQANADGSAARKENMYRQRVEELTRLQNEQQADHDRLVSALKEGHEQMARSAAEAASRELSALRGQHERQLGDLRLAAERVAEEHARHLERSLSSQRGEHEQRMELAMSNAKADLERSSAEHEMQLERQRGEHAEQLQLHREDLERSRRELDLRAERQRREHEQELDLHREDAERRIELAHGEHVRQLQEYEERLQLQTNRLVALKSKQLESVRKCVTTYYTGLQEELLRDCLRAFRDHAWLNGQEKEKCALQAKLVAMSRQKKAVTESVLCRMLNNSTEALRHVAFSSFCVYAEMSRTDKQLAASTDQMKAQLAELSRSKQAITKSVLSRMLANGSEVLRSIAFSSFIVYVEMSKNDRKLEDSAAWLRAELAAMTRKKKALVTSVLCRMLNGSEEALKQLAFVSFAAYAEVSRAGKLSESSLAIERRRLQEELTKLEREKQSMQQEMEKQRKAAQVQAYAPTERGQQHPLDSKGERVLLKLFRFLFESKFSSTAEEDLISLVERYASPGTSKAEISREVRKGLASKRDFDVRKAFRRFDTKKIGAFTAVQFDEGLRRHVGLDRETATHVYYLIDSGAKWSKPDASRTPRVSTRTVPGAGAGGGTAAALSRSLSGASSASAVRARSPGGLPGASGGVRARSPNAGVPARSSVPGIRVPESPSGSLSSVAPMSARRSGASDGVIAEEEFVRLFSDPRLLVAS